MKKIKTYKLFESKKSVEDRSRGISESGRLFGEIICSRYNIQNWTLNPDGTVDVDGDVDLYKRGLSKLPLKFGRVTGYFRCSDNNLTSLEGSPNWVGSDFSCVGNKLTSLEGSPNWVGEYFGCSRNKLTNLIGGPNFVDGSFDCSNNKLTNLEGCPEKIFGSLHCQSNEIHSLDHYPTILTGKLFTSGNPIGEIWENVIRYKRNNHGYYLLLFQLHDPIRFEDGEWVCHRFRLDNFFDEIGVTTPQKLENYKEV